MTATLEYDRRFRMIFEANALPMFVWSVSEGIVDANDGLLAAIGYSRDDFRRRLVPVAALLPRTRGRYETQVPHKSGRIAYLSVHAIADECGDEGVACVTDLTEQRVAQESLASTLAVLEERTAKLVGAERDAAEARSGLVAQTKYIENLASRLARAHREMEAFSYSVSHDLRTPLRSIAGFSKAIAERATGLDERTRDYLTRIMNAASKMSQLIDEMLKLARISRKSPAHERVELSAIAQELIAELRRAEPHRRVETIIAPDLVAEGDASLLRVVLENLLSNAWKFTSRREFATIEVGSLRDGGHTLFYVRDDGAGFDMKYADKLFAPFQRLHTINEFDGTGIGLATVQRVIQMHGGQIHAQAEVHRGATFYFTIGDPRPPGWAQSAPEETSTS